MSKTLAVVRGVCLYKWFNFIEKANKKTRLFQRAVDNRQEPTYTYIILHHFLIKELKTQLDDDKLKREVGYWSEIISEKLKISPDDLQFLLRKIIKDNHDKNYSDLIYRAISETKMYAPGNKKAYLISLLTKYFFKEN